MHRLHVSRHTVPAALVVVAALLAPLFAAGPGGVTGAAGSATARAASNDRVPAPDHRFAVGSPAMTTAQQIAEQHWNAKPCRGEVRVAWTQLEADTNATAAWRNPTDAWNNAGENFDCVIEFNAGADYDWPKLCTVMTHEMGHLVGQPHALRDGELMSPVYSEPLPACTGDEPGAPAPAPEVILEDEESEPVVALSAVDRRSVKRTSAKKRAKGSKKNCTRRFSAKGRRTLRCAKPQRRAGRIARKRR